MSHMDQYCFSAPSQSKAISAVSFLRDALADIAQKITVDSGTPRVVVHSRDSLPDHAYQKIEEAGLKL